MEMALPVVAALAHVSSAFNAPFACVVVFGVHIDGNPVSLQCDHVLCLMGCLCNFRPLGCGRTSYRGHTVPALEKELQAPPRSHLLKRSGIIVPRCRVLDIASSNLQLKATSLQEIDDLCDEWEPEPLCPPIKEGARIDSPMLERYVSPFASNIHIRFSTLKHKCRLLTTCLPF
jgi:serine palmitoyltransferase